MRLSLEGRLASLLLAVLIVAVALCAWLATLIEPTLAAIAAFAIALLPALWLARRAAAPVRRLLRALSGAVASYRDGDFSLSLVADRHDELGDLVLAHNDLGAALREQRQHLAQRELLLDTVTQHSPVAILLVDSHSKVVYANLAARHLLNDGKSLHGLDFGALVARWPQPLQQAVAASEDSLFSVEIDRNDETFHLSQRGLLLRGRPHRLYLLKRLTRELSRQEVGIWKKLIRVLSHELNNSLAPISSLAHSGAELARRGDVHALPEVFTTIGERSRHLHDFIAGYAKFARLPKPQPDAVLWADLVQDLKRQLVFALPEPLPAEPGWFDRIQTEQLLINLLKNAHESGSDPAAVELGISHVSGWQRIEVRDRGGGMTEIVLTQALLPFYSTKRSGSGLGLALAREIAEAHGGQIRLDSRAGGGLNVTILLPLNRPDRDP
jgi:nitrogen fixation/metabolism regulation signal transduction histidine kinase